MSLMNDAILAINRRTAAVTGAEPNAMAVSIDASLADPDDNVRALVNGLVFDTEDIDATLEALTSLAELHHKASHLMTCPEHEITLRMALVQAMCAGIYYERKRVASCSS